MDHIKLGIRAYKEEVFSARRMRLNIGDLLLTV